MAHIEKVSSEFCEMCGYCMPCPHGVHIPMNFGLYNKARYLGQVDWAKEHYSRLSKQVDGDKSAAACKNCGECEPKCPNDIPIVKQLREVARRLG
jgi:predicted aldo/keto reductase-like oxidoreductase